MDREKVISGLHDIGGFVVGQMGIEQARNFLRTIDDTLVLLKEQEAVKPKKANNPEENEYCCGICGYPLWLDELYCAHCGRRIEWKGR